MANTFANLGRLREITAVAVRHGLGHYLAGRQKSRRENASREEVREEVKRSAQRFRKVLEELGTTFLKFGQVLSTRADLLPPGFAEALRGLQDDCPAMPFSDVEGAIVAELGAPLKTLYASFERAPIATASIAQVHRAQTHDGDVVAVKVQRLGIRRAIERDLDLLRFLAQLIEAIIEESGLVTPRAIVDEFENALLRELDFCREARMIERFADNASGQNRSYVVPVVYSQLSARGVLTMSFVEGRRMSALHSATEKLEVTRKIVAACFDQVFVDGLFHADPHPGNCLILATGQLALIDFGAVGQISYPMRETLVVLVLSVGMRDADAIARLFYRLSTHDRRVNLHRLRDAIAQLLADKVPTPVAVAHLGAARLLGELFDVAARFRVRIPSEYALVTRAAMTVEGVIRELDPKLTVLGEMQPYLRRLVEDQFRVTSLGEGALKNLLRARDVVRELPLTLSQILMDLEGGHLQIEMNNPHFAQIARSIDTLGIMVFMGLIAGGLVSGALYCLARYETRLFGLPLVPSLAFYVASILFGTALGRYFLAPRIKKISLARRFQRRARTRDRRA